MSAPLLSTPANDLISRLPHRERDRLIAVATLVELSAGEILCETGEPVRHAYFPVAGFISLVTTLGQRPPLEMGLVGREGMLGTNLALGVSLAMVGGMVQGAGRALRLSAGQLKREMNAIPALRLMLHRYQYVLTAQLLRTAACTHFHEIGPRLARWLLMTHDRVEGDDLHLTHEFLSYMLGVRRGGVTIAAGALQSAKLIRYVRGEITVIDRLGLERASCDCYEATKAVYATSFAGRIR